MATPGLSCGTLDLPSSLQHMSSLVATCKLFNCSMWDLVPWPGVESRSPALGVQSLSHWATREVPSFASELNSVLFYWHDQHPAEGPFLGPNFKGLVTVANVLTVRNFKICIYDPEHFYRPQDSWSYPRLFQKRELETKVYAQALNAEWDTASGVKEREYKQRKADLSRIHYQICR